MNISPKNIFIFFLIFLFTTTAYANTQYVSDELFINMRSGKGNGFKITNIIKSGTELTILKKESGYTKVRTPNGHEGWVLSRFLIKTPIARKLLAQAQLSVVEMKEKYELMATELNSITIERNLLSNSEKQLLDNQEVINIELEKLKNIASRPMQLEKETD